MNPYWGNEFFGFFLTLFIRFVTGQMSDLAPDELQIAVLSMVAISCGLIGPFLVLKKMTMFANSLSHTILVGIVGAYLLASSLWGGALSDISTLLIGALAAALITALCTEGLARVFRLQEDASIGLSFTALFALGITIVTLYTRNVHLGIESIMGNADVLQPSDLRFSSLLVTMNLTAIFLFYRQFQVASFDRHFAKTLGMSGGFSHFLLLILAAATCIGAFRAVGVLLVLAFLVGPFLIVRLFCHRLPWILFWSPCVGIFASLLGVALARHFLTVYGMALSTGGIVVTVIALFYCAAQAFKKFYWDRFLKSATL